MSAPVCAPECVSAWMGELWTADQLSAETGSLAVTGTLPAAPYWDPMDGARVDLH